TIDMAPRHKRKTDGDSSEPLSGCVITVCGKFNRTHQQIEKDIKTLGGTYKKSFSKQVTHLIATRESYNRPSDLVKKAKKQHDCKIVDVKWLEKCSKSGSQVNTTPYLLDQQDENKQDISDSQTGDESSDESGSESGDDSSDDSGDGSGNQSEDDLRKNERHKKEEKGRPLENMYICVIDTLKDQNVEQLKKGIRALGGHYQTTATKKTTHLCASQHQFDSLQKDILYARDNGVLVVSLSWLNDTLYLKELQSTDKYVLRSSEKTRSEGSPRRSTSSKNRGSEEESSEDEEESDEEQYESPTRSNTHRAQNRRMATPPDSEGRRSTTPAKKSDLFWSTNTKRLLAMPLHPPKDQTQVGSTFIQLVSDPDQKTGSKNKPLDGEIVTEVYRGQLLVAAPGKNPEYPESMRAFLVQGSCYGGHKASFRQLGKAAMPSGTKADFPGLTLDKMNVVLVASDEAERVSLVLFLVDGTKHLQLASRTTLNGILGNKKGDQIVIGRRKLVGQNVPKEMKEIEVSPEVWDMLERKNDGVTS
ncbi:hypothetical protein ACHAPW_008693, partial [Verticillium nonalfalfae]